MKTNNHTKYIIFLFLLIIIGTHYSCNKVQNSSIRVYAASSTFLPVNEICDYYSDSNPISYNYAASGILARQINAGANADIFLSANYQWIDYLAKQNLLINESIKELTQNKLVVICLKEKDLKIKFNKDFKIETTIENNISIGNPEYVPAGRYAKQVLDSLGWYKQIENKIILSQNVTSALRYVELGECDWGIVYYSEALKSDKVKVAYEISQELYKPIIFYIAMLNENQKSKDLYNFFLSDSAKDIFYKYGFTIN